MESENTTTVPASELDNLFNRLESLTPGPSSPDVAEALSRQPIDGFTQGLIAVAVAVNEQLVGLPEPVRTAIILKALSGAYPAAE